MNPLFKVHKLNAAGIEKAKYIAEGFEELLQRLEALCPVGRETSIARTKLEEACFYAKKAMALDSTNQEKP